MPTGSDGGGQPPAGRGAPVAAGQQPGAVTSNSPNNNITSQGHGRHDRHNRLSGNSVRQMNQPKFEGREPSLKGFIYDATGEHNPDQYIKTMKEIINYVGRTYTKYTAKFMQAMRDLKLGAPTAPVNPDPNNPLAFKMWKLDIKEYRVKEQEYSNFCAGLYNMVLGSAPRHCRTS